MNEQSRGIQMMSDYIEFSMFDPFLMHITHLISRYLHLHRVFVHIVSISVRECLPQYLSVRPARLLDC